MRINIDLNKLQKYSLTLGDVLLSIAEVYNIDLEATARELVRVDEATEDLLAPNFNIRLSRIIHDRVTGFIADCTPTKCTEDELLNCAKRLKEIYPKGKKPGTNNYWADSPALIVERLKLFFRKYGEYPLDDIVKATQKYVDENLGKPFMRTLVYFIMKNDTKGGEVEKKSDLLNYMDLKEEKDEILEEDFARLF